MKRERDRLWQADPDLKSLSECAGTSAHRAWSTTLLLLSRSQHGEQRFCSGK
jgi:hypothetical protein